MSVELAVVDHSIKHTFAESLKRSMIVSARPEHAAEAAQLIVSTDKHLFQFCGNGSLEPWISLAAAEWRPKDGLYSYRFSKVFEVDGEVKGVIVAYPFDRAFEQIDWKLENSRRSMNEAEWECAYDRFFEIAPTLFPMPPKGIFYIQNLAVAEEFQGRGIGRALMETAFEDARAEGFSKAMLDVDSTSTSSVGFYERMGFKVTSITPNPAPGMHVHFQMTCDL